MGDLQDVVIRVHPSWKPFLEQFAVCPLLKEELEGAVILHRTKQGAKDSIQFCGDLAVQAHLVRFAEMHIKRMYIGLMMGLERDDLGDPEIPDEM